MNLLLIFRSEILNIVILLFLLGYSRYCYRFRTGPDYFLAFVITALGAAVMALVTEYTVNTPSTYGIVNDTCHIFFYAFTLLFCLTLFRYILSLVVPRNRINKISLCPFLLCIIAIIISIFAPKTYIQGNGTNSSSGIGVYLCFAMAGLIFALSTIILIVYAKNIQKSVLIALFPILISSIVLAGIQAFIPEFLFSSGIGTLMCIGTFFAIENPAYKLEERVFIDANTGIYSRNKYENDIKKLKEKPIGIVLCDLNRLKYVNDNYGHLEGDVQIRLAVDAIQKALKDAYGLYRVGGDEFIALYNSMHVDDMYSQAEMIAKECKNNSTGRPVPVAVSYGCSTWDGSGTYEDAIKEADTYMYQNKEKYYKESGIERRK